MLKDFNQDLQHPHSGPETLSLMGSPTTPAGVQQRRPVRGGRGLRPRPRPRYQGPRGQRAQVTDEHVVVGGTGVLQDPSDQRVIGVDGGDRDLESAVGELADAKFARWREAARLEQADRPPQALQHVVAQRLGEAHPLEAHKPHASRAARVRAGIARAFEDSGSVCTLWRSHRSTITAGLLARPWPRGRISQQHP